MLIDKATDIPWLMIVHVDSHDVRDGVVSSTVLVLVGHYKVQYNTHHHR